MEERTGLEPASLLLRAKEARLRADWSYTPTTWLGRFDSMGHNSRCLSTRSVCRSERDPSLNPKGAWIWIHRGKGLKVAPNP